MRLFCETPPATDFGARRPPGTGRRFRHRTRAGAAGIAFFKKAYFYKIEDLNAIFQGKNRIFRGCALRIASLRKYVRTI
jgi:hypothetical protein